MTGYINKQTNKQINENEWENKWMFTQTILLSVVHNGADKISFSFWWGIWIITETASRSMFKQHHILSARINNVRDYKGGRWI